jgi:hypothetical protein
MCKSTTLTLDLIVNWLFGAGGACERSRDQEVVRARAQTMIGIAQYARTFLVPIVSGYFPWVLIALTNSLR